MKKILYIAAAALVLASCGQKKADEQKVMARAVPERMDDFVWENNLVAYRAYGKALEGNPTAPGFDVWVKLPGQLVADKWYAEAQKEPEYYHHNHDGKDCYKVSVSLGAGGSSPVIDGQIQYPATNYRSSEILKQTPDTVVFVLHYPQWQLSDSTLVSLDKKITVAADTYFLESEDTYTFSGADSLQVAAGIYLHADQNTVEKEDQKADRYAIWEHASDQSVEPEDGMLGIAIYVPGADLVEKSADGSHALVGKKIVSGEPFTYYFGSCWSKGDVKTAEDWFSMVDALK